MSALKFSFPQFENRGSAMLPLPLPGEVCRVTTADASGRDAGGCVAPDVRGFVIRKDAEQFEIRNFRIHAHRDWTARTSRRVDDSVLGSPVGWYTFLPALVWWTIKSAYHHDHDSAEAEVEVISEPSPEWLVEEMAAIGETISLKQAAGVLDSRERLLRDALAEEPPCPSLEGVWAERARMDIRALALRWMDGNARGGMVPPRERLELFADPRPPFWRRYAGCRVLTLRGRVIAKIPETYHAAWQAGGFSAPLK